MFIISDDTVHIRIGGLRAQTRASKAPTQRTEYCLLFRCDLFSDITVLEGQLHCYSDISLKYSLLVLSYMKVIWEGLQEIK